MPRYADLTYWECFSLIKAKSETLTKTHGTDPIARAKRREIVDNLSDLVTALEALPMSEPT